MDRKTHLRIRKSHRYLGLVTGIQFALWTIGGLYFSWSDIDEIHGDHQRRHTSALSPQMELVAPTQVLAHLQHASAIVSLKLIDILGTPHYQVVYQAEGGHDHSDASTYTLLANATTGDLRPALTEQEAVQLALGQFSDSVRVAQIEYLTDEQVGGHHEYRGSALPAWAVTMEHPTQTTVYVAAEQGVVTKFRNNKWRVFDFLWMLHTMDYQGRDNFGNLLLRVFSIAGIVTVLSGLALYFVSNGNRRRPQQGNQRQGTPFIRNAS